MTAFAQTYHRKPLALTAMPFGVSGAVRASAVDKLSVTFVERVSALAMRFGGIVGLDRIPSQRVRPHADEFQVRGVHATAIPAQMVNDLCGIEDRAVSQLVGETRRPQRPVAVVGSTSDPEAAVAISIKSQEPRPAAVAIWLTSSQSKSGSVRHCFCDHALQPTTYKELSK